MGLNERLKQFAEYKRLTPKLFETRSGLGNGTFAKISENTRHTTLEKIFRAFPDLNTTWLLTGEGEMIVHPTQITHGDHSPAISGNGNRVTSAADAMAEIQWLRERLAAEQDNLRREQEQTRRLTEIIASSLEKK